MVCYKPYITLPINKRELVFLKKERHPNVTDTNATSLEIRPAHINQEKDPIKAKTDPNYEQTGTNSLKSDPFFCKNRWNYRGKDSIKPKKEWNSIEKDPNYKENSLFSNQETTNYCKNRPNEAENIGYGNEKTTAVEQNTANSWEMNTAELEKIPNKTENKAAIRQFTGCSIKENPTFWRVITTSENSLNYKLNL